MFVQPLPRQAAILTTITAFILAQGSLVASAPSESLYVQKFRIDADLFKEAKWVKPDFCRTIDCPEFKEVLNKTEYEERDYLPSKWVSTHLQGIDYDEAIRTMFMKLFYYIGGKNSKKEKIDMTAPVLTRVIPGPGPACESNFTMHFFMSPTVEDPPQPTDDTVFLSSLPQQKVFVRHFGGFASQSDYLREGKALAEALIKDSRNFDSNYFYTAGYDSPFQILHRHNEVWYIAK